jgi:hypothetical protein
MSKDKSPSDGREQVSRSTQAGQLAESLLARLSHLKAVYTPQDREQANASLMEVSQQIAEFGTDDIIKAIDQRLNQARQEVSAQRNMMTTKFMSKVTETAGSITIDMGNMGAGWERMSALDAVKMLQEYPLKHAVNQRRNTTEEHLNNYVGESRQLGDFFNNRTNELSAARGLVQGLALRLPQSEK